MNSMTQEELSTALGISKSAVSMYERGAREPQSLADLVAITDFFSVSPDSLVGRGENDA